MVVSVHLTVHLACGKSRRVSVVYGVMCIIVRPTIEAVRHETTIWFDGAPTSLPLSSGRGHSHKTSALRGEGVGPKEDVVGEVV